MDADLVTDIDLALAALRRVILRAIEAGTPRPAAAAEIAIARAAKAAAIHAARQPAPPAPRRPIRQPPALPAAERINCPPPVEANGVTVDFAAGPAGTVTYAGRTVNVSRRQAQAVAVLARALPHVIPRGEIARRAWPDLLPLSGQTTLSQMHPPLTERLATIGLALKEMRKFGFALMPADRTGAA